MQSLFNKYYVVVCSLIQEPNFDCFMKKKTNTIVEYFRRYTLKFIVILNILSFADNFV